MRAQESTISSGCGFPAALFYLLRSMQFGDSDKERMQIKALLGWENMHRTLGYAAHWNGGVP